MSIRMAKIRQTNNIKCEEKSGAPGTLSHRWLEFKMVQSLWKFLIKINVHLLSVPAIKPKSQKEM